MYKSARVTSSCTDRTKWSSIFTLPRKVA